MTLPITKARGAECTCVANALRRRGCLALPCLPTEQQRDHYRPPGPGGKSATLKVQRVGKGRAVGVPPTRACRRPPRSARVQCWFPAQPPRGRTRRCRRSRRTRRSRARPPRVPLWRPPYYQVPALQLSPPASQPWRPRADVQTSWRADWQPLARTRRPWSRRPCVAFLATGSRRARRQR